MSTNLPTLARVASVYRQNGQVYLDVEPGRPGSTMHEIRFVSSAPGLMVTPSQGDYVEVYDNEDGKAARYNFTSPEYSMPDLPEGSYIQRFNAGSEISAIKQDDGTYKVTVSGDKEVVVQSEGGKVSIQGDTINLGEGSKGVITDIETSTDADGHITSITPVRSTKINVE